MRWSPFLLLAVLLWMESPLCAEEPALFHGSSVTAAGPMEALSEGFAWPVSKGIPGQRVSIVSKFGWPHAPESTQEEMHEGVDFGVPTESAVRAARSGKVLFAGFSNAYVSRVDKKEKHRLVILRHTD